jgi:glucose-1-phosphate thymidylyltransferase
MVKCILPLGRGGGYDPDSNTTPYHINVAGKPLIGHLIDQLLPLHPEEIICILGSEDEALMRYVKESYDIPFRFILQKQGKGSAHAVFGAKDHVQGEVVILFGDTFFEASFADLAIDGRDGILWTSVVEDPRELGVVFLHGGLASRLIEKPDEPVSNLALVGLYYFNDAKRLFDAIAYLLRHGIQTKGSFHLTDAIQLMIDQGARIEARPADSWIDADRGEGLFALSAKLIAASATREGIIRDSVVIDPVYIPSGAVVDGCVIGPNVSLASGAVVRASVVRESVLESGAKVSDAVLTHSVIGPAAVLDGRPRKIMLAREGRLRME